MPRVKTVVDGQPYVEELTLDQLSTWCSGRWLAGQGPASDNILSRARALVEATQKNKTVIRDEGNGELIVIDTEVPKVPEDPKK